jgi:phosphate transport system permease protein
MPGSPGVDPDILHFAFFIRLFRDSQAKPQLVMSEPKTFTGVRREKHTRWSVRFADIASRSIITIGGIGTIAAISLVFVLLALEVIPLFYSPTATNQTSTKLAWGDDELLHVAIDEYRTMGWALNASGSLIVFRADTGEILQRKPLFADAEVTASSFAVDGPSVSVGFGDGTARLGTIDFSAQLIDLEKQQGDARKILEGLEPGGVTAFGGGIAQRLAQGGFRHQKISVEFAEPVRLSESKVTLIDHYADERRSVLCALTSDNKIYHTSIRRITAIDGTVRLRPSQKVELPYHPRSAAPLKLLLTGMGDGVMLAWKDGHAARYDCRDPKEVAIAEEVDIIADGDASLTACELLIGRSTIVAGDSKGRVSAWFTTRPDDAKTVDGLVLVRGHEMPSSADSAVTSLGMSLRMRMCLAGFEDGSMRLFHITTDQEMLNLGTIGQSAVSSVAIAPKDDALFATTGEGLWSCNFDPKHPEATAAALFRPVWYESYEKPEHVWQSVGSTSDYEPKLGLMPLVFGTFKATFYSMLFGAPLALLAAIYTSEFLSPRSKAKIKPTIELMASLPSVVLGFLAGLVIAQFVEKRVAEVLTTFVTVPFMVLLGAFLWQLMAQRTTILYAWARLPAILVLGAIGVCLGWIIGPVAQNVFFAGDIMKWLNGQTAAPEFDGNLFDWLVGQAQGGAGAWFFLLLPLSALGIAMAMGMYVNPWMRIRFGEVTRRRFAVMNLLKYLAGAAATLIVAYLLSVLLSLIIGDPRGSRELVDTYVQRNSLVVGVIMGFAIIPIIYTIAEDALTTVPQHLRSASLGAGATPWQTALRIVIPTAMSGLFSALMIGLGRAVGETMIVLMAAGNTPILEMNVFNGFRTLAANIATEMPEAARDSTHYRVLFLCALTLFVMTFAVNTVAEVVRQRFRRRAYQL